MHKPTHWRTYLYVLALTLVQSSVFYSARANAGFPQDFDDVVWLHTNVSSWAQTAVLSSVSTNSGTITLNYDKANAWPGKTITASAGGSISVNGNPWIFVQKGDTWYAATFEWLKFGQTTKNIAAVKGDHIKKSPLSTFVPKAGEVYGFMVSGLARTSLRNVNERSNVVMFEWGKGMISYCTVPPDVKRFRASSQKLLGGQVVNLSWDIQGADSARISPAPGHINPEKGDVDILVEKTTTFSLSAANDCGTSLVKKTIKVQNIGSLLIPVIGSLLDD